VTWLLAWLRRAWTYLVTHPKVAAGLAVLASIGSLVFKLRWTQRQRDKAVVRAETAEVDGQVAVARARAEGAKQDIAAAEAVEHQAAGEHAGAKVESDNEVERRRKIAARWEEK
jgi:hypothetical protein